jgi:uncharacterized membrane protein
MAAARKGSQVITHMAIGFAIAYACTGSIALGGLAVLVEPVLNVLLLPLHERWWAQRVHAASGRRRYVLVSLEKISQAVMHAVIAFLILYLATGSVASGGMAALLEPVCNVMLMPLHDRLWDGAQRAAVGA